MAVGWVSLTLNPSDKPRRYRIPFGGAKQSGIGTEFAEEGLAEFTPLPIINAER